VSMGKIVLSLGGNALVPSGGPGSAGSQWDIAKRSLEPVADLIAEGHLVVITHGNGPIVGNIWDRNRAAAAEIPPMPLDVCGADSQGGIGYMIQQVIGNVLAARRIGRSVVSLVTQVVVDSTDPAFAKPTKPIGRFLQRPVAERLQHEEGWRVMEDAGRGFRRVVPSPRPLEIVEWEAIRDLVDAGVVVVAVGGGGIPVVRRADGTLHGVEAVVDKDLASSLLARRLGAEGLVTVTAVPRVAIRFGKPDQKELDRMTVTEARGHLRAGEFPEGSMGPKILGAVEFLEAGGRWAVVTDPVSVREAIAGRRGTRLVPDAGARVRA